jgi:hypothetical protein
MGHGRAVQNQSRQPETYTCDTGAGGWDPNTPIIGLTQINSISAKTGMFDSSFDYENFMNIYNSVGPGSYTYDGYGTKPDVADAYGADVAMTKAGPPTGKCNDSIKAVGDTVGLANINGITSQRLVSDINTVFAFGGYKIVGANKIFMSPVVIGWVYKDDAGAYWFQKDPAVSWQYSLTATINLTQWLSVAATAAKTSNEPIFMGDTPPSEPPHTVDGQCYSGGSVFYPDGIS